MHHYYKIYKPAGYLSQFISNQTTRKNKKKLGALYPFAKDTMHVGRLDQNSEGLLLLTTDGIQCNQILSNKYEKEYYAQIDGLIDDDAVQKLSEGVHISINKSKYLTKPCKVKSIDTPDLPTGYRIRDERHGPTSWVSIILTEGKYRQVRKMTAAVGFPTLRLVRVRIGHHHLEDMQPGDVIEIPQLV